VEIRKRFKEFCHVEMGKLSSLLVHRSVFLMVFSPLIVGIWEAMELLNTMQDDSDPDVRRSFFANI